MDGVIPVRPRRRAAPRPVIGLVNNMSAPAMAASHEHFAAALADSKRDFELRHLTLRDEAGPAGCAPVAFSPETAVDAFIVTGMEPTTPDLRDEKLWPRLQALHDWCERHEIPVLWSCLSAHAAVLHRDGIRRQRLPMKISGVFGCAAAAPRHRLLKGLPAAWSCPHSRHNGLPEAALAGEYIVLSRAGIAGVDIFTRADGTPFFYFQGHPEYRPDTLLREYIRDARRFIGGEQPVQPFVPANYLEDDIEQTLAELCESRRGDALAGIALTLRGIRAEWHEARRALFGNWLDIVADGAARRTNPMQNRNHKANTNIMAREALA